jgi:hypothetical protein
MRMRLVVWYPRVLDKIVERTVYQLRGGTIFDYLGEQGELLQGMPVTVAHASADGVPTFTPAAPGTVLYTGLAVLVDNPSLEEAAFSMGCPVIIDLHFPLDNTERMFKIQDVKPGEERDVEQDDEARRLWSDPARQRRARLILNRAAAVTVSPGGSVSGFDTVFLPDVKTPEDVAQFYATFVKLMFRVLPTRWRWQRWWNSLMLRHPIKHHSERIAEAVQLYEVL